MASLPSLMLRQGKPAFAKATARQAKIRPRKECREKRKGWQGARFWFFLPTLLLRQGKPAFAEATAGRFARQKEQDKEYSIRCSG